MKKESKYLQFCKDILVENIHVIGIVLVIVLVIVSFLISRRAGLIMVGIVCLVGALPLLCSIAWLIWQIILLIRGIILCFSSKESNESDEGIYNFILYKDGIPDSVYEKERQNKIDEEIWSMENKIHNKSYPMFLLPSISDLTEFSFAMNAKTKKKGFAELIAYYHLDKTFGNRVFANTIVLIDGHKYEPDFAYINKKRNIFIDIEIDEPYTIGKKPTHYLFSSGKSVDFKRDSLFQKAGWYVIRFSEEQFYKQPNGCVEEIRNLLKIIGEEVGGNPESPSLKKQDRWTAHKSNYIYRNTYLGFNPFKITVKGLFKIAPRYIQIMFRSIWRKNLRKEFFKHTLGYIWNKNSTPKKYRTKYQKSNTTAETISKHVNMFDKYLVSCINDSQTDLFDLAASVNMDFASLLDRISFLRENNVQINLDDSFFAKISLSPSIELFINEHLKRVTPKIEYDLE